MTTEALVLVVDDDPAVLRATSAVLTSEGFHVLQALRGADAVATALSHAPDVVLLDVVLPDMGGIEVCRRIKAEPGLEDTMVALASGIRIDESSRTSGLEGGADDYILRPVSNRELVARVRALSRLARVRRELRHQRDRADSYFDIAESIMVVLDREGRIVRINRKGQAVLGYSAQELEGRDWFEVAVPEEACADVRRAFDRLLAGELEPAEYAENHILTREGRRRIIAWRNALLRDSSGGIVGTLSSGEDITDRRKADEALRESEQAVRRKLQAVLEPEGDVGALGLADILDCARLQATMEDFHRATGMGSAIVDLSGRVLVAVGWQDICTRFHRVHPETLEGCRESDTALAAGAPPGAFKAYRCLNNMWDMATPIEVGGRHVGNMFLGQFFYADEIPDRTLFQRQAKQYGFDEEQYLAALDRVPRWSREKVQATMGFYARLADMVSSLGFGSIKLARALTQQEVAARRLRESEERYRTIVEGMTEGLIQVDNDDRIVFANDQVCRLLGRTREELVGRIGVEVLCAGEAGRELIREKNRMRQAGVADRYETTMLRADGMVIPVMVSGAPVRGPDGAVTGSVGLITDITERVRTEKELRASEHRLRAVFEGLHDAVTILSEDGQFVDCNQRALRMFGVESKERFMERRPADFSPPFQPDGRASMSVSRAHVAEALTRGGFVKFEWRHQRANGEMFPAEVILTSYRQGGQVFLQGMIRDITEQKKAECALRESEERYRTLVEGMAEGIIQSDNEDRIQYVNSRFCQIVGRNADELIGKIGYEAFAPEEEHDAIKAHTRSRQHGMIDTYESRMTTPDNSTVWVSICGSPVYGPDNVVVGSVGLVSDITARKLAEEALRESERLFSTLATMAPIGIFRTDAQGATTYVNPRWSEISGLLGSEALGDGWLRAVHPDDRAALAAAWQRNSEGRVESRAEYRFVRPNGDVVWVWGLAAPEIDRHGNVTGYIGAIADMTERVHAEKLLHATQAMYQVVFQATGTATLIVEEDTTIAMANSECLPVTGYGPRELVGTKWPSYVAPESLEMMLKYHTLRRKEPGNAPRHYEVTLINKDGEPRHAVLDIGIIPGTGQSVVSMLDITERKRAEDTLRTSEAQLSNALQMARAGHWEYDVGSDTFTFNDNFYRIFRTTVEEVGGYQMSSADYARRFCHPDDVALVGEEVQAALETTDPNYRRQIEHRVLRANGEVGYITVRFFIVKDSQGRTTKTCGVNQDITERKLAEAEREKLQGQLIQAQRMEAVGQLAGGVAHDFNNMLQVILGHTDMALGQVDAADPLHADLEEIRRAAQRSADLTRQLLAFARRQTVTPKALALNDTVEGMLKMLRRLIGEDIRLSWKPGAGLWSVKMDPSQVDQVLANLCVNARDAIRGVGEVTIETGNVTVDEAYCADRAGFVPGSYVQLTVSDDGCGMEKGVLEHLFEPFFTTKGVGEGTGLGLSTVYGIVKQNEGFIDVCSEAGKGTTFEIYLRRHGEEAVEAAAERGGEVLRGGSEMVLFVEDDEAVLRMGVRMLQGLGYRVMSTASPEEGVRRAEEQEGEIALLITDVVMPGMNGRELARRVAGVKPGVKCLYISGYTADVMARRGVLEEGVRFLQKPFTLEALARKVREALEE